VGATLKSRLPALAAHYRVTMAQALEAIGRSIEGEAKIRAPIDTGALVNSIRYVSVSATSGRVQVGVEYAPFVEYGTIYMDARPYLLPAVEVVRARLGPIVAVVFGSGGAMPGGEL
jgi:HK97 gp10 family phage protein